MVGTKKSRCVRRFAGNVTVNAIGGKSGLSLAEAQAKGMELGSTSATIDSLGTDGVVKMVRTLLGF